ncbi:hypothetical protein BLOT_009668 [Blomia tropicalis]|nr:hypothetical protein BLOT_009668 [Blomia tropicalis]
MNDYICKSTFKIVIGLTTTFAIMFDHRFVLVLLCSISQLAITIETLDSEHNKLSCQEHFKCDSPDRAPDHLQFLKLNSSVPNWYELCNCDPYCHIFGDCCADAPILQYVRLSEWSFVKVRLSSKITYMSLMKSKCPREWKSPKPNSVIKERCESNSMSSMYDYLMPDLEHMLLMDSDDEFSNWHVTSRETLITYRNIYCGICNSDHQVESWNQRLRCLSSDKNSPNDPIRCTSAYYQTSPELIGKEKLKRTPLQNKVYSSCNVGWYKINVQKRRDYVLDTAKKCLIYYEPVVVRDSKNKNKFIVFKNKYCAMCNDYDQSVHECPSQAIDSLTQVPASFNFVTNYDTNYERGSSYGANNESCEMGQVYSPLTNVCFKLDRTVASSDAPAPTDKLHKLAGINHPLSSSSASIYSFNTILPLILVRLNLY